ncbi:family 2A encapsulin nanocompartment cargo protein cysteine desulfurase [Acinetobacter shaoyimingii]|uniref:cysteine desulfurase n=1 Tax=Acinetobacter shaoyimingii TaxID=2715164 RepID=A0A6G8RUP5_9GAMM|nr:family 2A encapsulin nanocompartment cargo protein cysteine desulfurase [Acinetobacter shaoyimingii]QIO05644.1 cysteine desulfurase [Acinetobacter shaoyimingii]
MTIQQPINNQAIHLTDDVVVPTNQSVFDESILNQLAAEFFSAQTVQSPQGFNFDLPNQAPSITHHPQPKDPFLALAGRIPAVAKQSQINPSVNQQYVDPTADHPERRIISSAPIVGGAKTPDPLGAIQDLNLSLLGQPEAIPNQVPRPDPSSFYFLDFQAPNPTAPVANVDLNENLRNPYAYDDFHVVDDHQLKSVLKDRNDKPATPESGFYFLNQPEVNSGYTSVKDDAQIPLTQQAYQPLDILRIRQDFPILQERVNGKPLVWFDNAATTHKPLAVIERICQFYKHENSNIHRAAHELAARASDAYEHARDVVARFIGAKSSNNIVFVRGTTEGINLIAKSWGKQNIQAGDEIIVSHLEHHANIVPWYQLTQETGAKLRVIPVDDTGQIRLDEFAKLLNPRTKLVSVTQVSNALGTVTPTAEIIALAHAAGVRVLIDGAQSVSHMPTNVTALDADFFVFSGHKVFGPTGIGAVYAKSELLDSMPVWEGGGNMIQDVTFEHVIYQPAPNKFEAGTGNIADAVGLGAALEYVESLGIHNIARYEHDLLHYGQNALASVSGLRPIGTAQDKASVMSFVLEGYETEQVGKILNQHGIAVRTGHHCAQPILRRFGVEKTVRPSLAFYNTTEEIDLLVSVLHQLRRAKPYRS